MIYRGNPFREAHDFFARSTSNLQSAVKDLSTIAQPAGAAGSPDIKRVLESVASDTHFASNYVGEVPRLVSEEPVYVSNVLPGLERIDRVVGKWSVQVRHLDEAAEKLGPDIMAMSERARALSTAKGPVTGAEIDDLKRGISLLLDRSEALEDRTALSVIDRLMGLGHVAAVVKHV